ncbi:MAG: 50S ribosomal protein L24e [Candidatus Wukongarchaeota archaeon]|nr:50S ribosomal protein L24e [Candidatus Wukongarchaeota archaeon]
MDLTKCSFCGSKLTQGTGKMLVLKSGVIRYFCSSKCEGSWKMGRDPKKIRWTEIFRKEK